MHTPGPWTAEEARTEIDYRTYRIGQEHSTETLANAHDLGRGRVGEAHDNARLIAAAPDLLTFAQAIESVVMSTGHNLNSTATREERSAFISRILKAWNTNHAAITKATEG